MKRKKEYRPNYICFECDKSVRLRSTYLFDEEKQKYRCKACWDTNIGVTTPETRKDGHQLETTL